MKVLVALAQRRGEVVSRDELADRCWDGRIVGDDVLNRTVLLLRGLARKYGGFSIETVPKAGYRLTESAGRLDRLGGIKWLAAGIAALVVAGTAFRLSQDRQPYFPVVELAPIRGASEPFSAELAKASDSALAEMLTNGGMPVVTPAAAEEQRADLRLSGQIRTLGEEVEATLQIDDLRHGVVLLSRQFRTPRSKANGLPGQLGAFSATALASTGAMMVLDDRRPGDPRLSGELLRQFSMLVAFEDPLQAYQAVDRLSQLMPDSAMTQLGLAMNSAHAIPLLPPGDRAAALDKARKAATRAHDLAPGFGDVYWSDCRLYPEVRFAECEQSMRTAFKIDPTAPFVAAELRNVLLKVGRYREALTYDRLAVAAMPYMAGRLGASTAFLASIGETEKARIQYEKVHRWWPEHPLPARNFYSGLIAAGDVERAVAFAETAAWAFDSAEIGGARAIADGLKRRDYGDLRRRCLDNALPGNLADVCLVALGRAGDLDAGYMLMDKVLPTRIAASPAEEDRLFLQAQAPIGVSFLSSTGMAPLRNDRRFVDVARRVGLLHYWREKQMPDFCTQDHEPICSRIAAA